MVTKTAKLLSRPNLNTYADPHGLREPRCFKLADVKKTPPPQTGPRTSMGKEHSSQNSTKHGLCGNPAKFLPGETQEQYNAIRDIWFAEYDSEAPGTARLLEPLINSDRMMRFAADAVTDAHTALCLAEAAAQPDYARIEMLHNDLKNKLRYKADHERSFQRALRNIEQFGQRRTREEVAGAHLKINTHKVAVGTAILCKRMGIDAELVFSLITAIDPEEQPKAVPVDAGTEPRR
jgi:hypothetical protein